MFVTFRSGSAKSDSLQRALGGPPAEEQSIQNGYGEDQNGYGQKNGFGGNGSDDSQDSEYFYQESTFV